MLQQRLLVVQEAASPDPPDAVPCVCACLNACSCYYFSVENLCKDLYLRNKMDADGFVSLAEIANFNRIRQITQDIRLVSEERQSRSPPPPVGSS